MGSPDPVYLFNEVIYSYALCKSYATCFPKSKEIFLNIQNHPLHWSVHVTFMHSKNRGLLLEFTINILFVPLPPFIPFTAKGIWSCICFEFCVAFSEHMNMYISLLRQWRYINSLAGENCYVNN